jgi:hypothetical protein
MRTITGSRYPHGSASFAESIKELPIDRYSEFQKYLLQDSGMGSDIESVARHFEKIDIFLAANKVQEAINERTNQHFNFFFMLNQINITHLSFAVLVSSITDQPITDYSETALLTVSKQLGKQGFTHEQLVEILEDVKKKLIPS